MLKFLHDNNNRSQCIKLEFVQCLTLDEVIKEYIVNIFDVIVVWILVYGSVLSTIYVKSMLNVTTCFNETFKGNRYVLFFIFEIT